MNPTCEFTAQVGDVKLWFSRKQDRVRLEPPSTDDARGTICIGSLARPHSDWLILVPSQRSWFRWSEARTRAENKTLVASRLFDAVLEKKYCAPGGQSLSILPQLVQGLTRFAPGPDARTRVVPRGEGRYELVECETFGTKGVPLWQHGLVVTRKVSHGTSTWCPELGVWFSALSNVQEAPIPPAVFQVPEGYQEMFVDGEGQEQAPALLLQGVMPEGFRPRSVVPRPAFCEVPFKEGKGVQALEAAYSGGRARGDDVDLQLRRVVFQGPDVAQAYAEFLRVARPDSRRVLPGEVYHSWETTPTAGEASFWGNPSELVFRRGSSVVVLSAGTNDRSRLAARRVLLQQLAPLVDLQLVQEKPSPAPGK